MPVIESDQIQSINAYVLTREWRDTPSGVDLTYWAASEHGPVQVRIPGTQTVCFVDDNELGAIPSALDVVKRSRGEIKPLALKALNGRNVAGAYFNRQRDLRDFVDWSRNHGINLYESDIRPADRYLMERFVTAPCEITGHFQSVGHAQGAGTGAYLRVDSPRLKPSKTTVDLSVCSIDIETSPDASRLYSVALTDGNNEKVFVVRPTSKSINIDVSQRRVDGTDEVAAFDVECCESEARCLEGVFDWLNETDPDVLIGWNVIGFDLKVLQQICQRTGVRFALGRGNAIARILEPRSSSDIWVAQVPGRAVIDGIDTLRTAFILFEDFSLQAVSSTLLGKGKLVTSQHRAEEITNLYETDLTTLCRYNLQDCRLVRGIFDQTKLIDFAVERARLTGLALGRAGGSVASFDNLYLPKLHRRGYVAPDRATTSNLDASPGGYLIDSRPGLYDNVLLLDFKSLYPSIIRSFLVDPLGMALATELVTDSANDTTTDKTSDTHTESDVDSARKSGEVPVEGFNGARFARDAAILPELIEQLWQERDLAKASGSAALSQAIKIIMNSFYGVLGSSGCRFFDPRLASSITRRGHEIIQRTQAYIENAGHPVIYGDTDSVFVLLGSEVDHVSARKTGDSLAKELNNWWRAALKDEHNIDSALEIEFEAHYEKFFMPTIRGADKGSKKRYAGRIRHVDGTTELVFKGLEAVRTDWTQLAREFQRELCQRVFNDEPFDDYLRDTVEGLYRGDFDAQLVYRKRLRRRVDEYTRNVPPHAQAARLLDKPGRWISYVITHNGPVPVELTPDNPDYDHYHERQLKPVADALLQFFDTSFDDVVSNQMSLFDA